MDCHRTDPNPEDECSMDRKWRGLGEGFDVVKLLQHRSYDTITAKNTVYIVEKITRKIFLTDATRCYRINIVLTLKTLYTDTRVQHEIRFPASLPVGSGVVLLFLSRQDLPTARLENPFLC
jgi:hypothetical protein